MIEEKSIVKQFLKKIWIDEGEDSYYSIGEACDIFKFQWKHEEYQRFCKELELLLELRECAFNHLEKWKEEDKEETK